MLEQHLGSAKLCPPEVLRGEDRAVDVGLGCKVDDRRAVASRALDVGRLCDVALVELDVLREIRSVARVRQLVEHDDLVACAQKPLGEM